MYTTPVVTYLGQHQVDAAREYYEYENSDAVFDGVSAAADRALREPGVDYDDLGTDGEDW